MLSRYLGLPKGSEWCFFFPSSESFSGHIGVGFGYLGELTHGLLYLAGYSSFKIDKQIFPASHRANVKKVSSCQYDILQKQNTI